MMQTGQKTHNGALSFISGFLCSYFVLSHSSSSSVSILFCISLSPLLPLSISSFLCLGLLCIVSRFSLRDFSFSLSSSFLLLFFISLCSLLHLSFSSSSFFTVLLSICLACALLSLPLSRCCRDGCSERVRESLSLAPDRGGVFLGTWPWHP